MKFKILIAGLLTAILAINAFTAYTLIQEEKKQTNLQKIIARMAVNDQADKNPEIFNWYTQFIQEINDIT